MRFLFIGIWFCTAGILTAQQGAAFWGLGGNEANRDAGFGLSNNPAATFTGKSTGGVWGHQRFTGTSLIQGGAAAAFRSKGTLYGGDLYYRGTSGFSVHSAHISLCQIISSQLSVGFSVDIPVSFSLCLPKGLRGSVENWGRLFRLMTNGMLRQ